MVQPLDDSNFMNLASNRPLNVPSGNTYCERLLVPLRKNSWKSCSNDALMQQLRREAFSKRRYDCIRVSHAIIRPCVGRRQLLRVFCIRFFSTAAIAVESGCAPRGSPGLTRRPSLRLSDLRRMEIEGGLVVLDCGDEGESRSG